MLRVEEGALYPALQKILLKGWVTSEWGISETNRKVRLSLSYARGPQATRDEVVRLAAGTRSNSIRTADRLRRTALNEFFRRLRYLTPASCVLLIIAALLGRALDHAMSANPGFDYQNVISINPGLAKHGYSPARANAYLETLKSRIGALPGVKSVWLALSPPLGNCRSVQRSRSTDGSSTCS